MSALKTRLKNHIYTFLSCHLHHLHHRQHQHTLLTTMASLWAQDTKLAINLGKGHPNPSLLPLPQIQAALQKAASSDNAPVALMQYGRMQGPGQLCESIAQWTEKAANNRSNLPTPENILITTGSGPSMSIVAQLFSQPGDLIFVDSPGYFLSYFTFKDCRLNVVNIPTDEHGISVDHIENLLKQGKIPSMVYTVPIANNPTGVSMSEDRKRRLIQLAQQYKFKICKFSRVLNSNNNNNNKKETNITNCLNAISI